MKFLQSALYGLILTVTAAAQTATPPSSTSTPVSPKAATPQSSSAQSSTSQPSSPAISTLGGDEVKGPEHPLTLDQMKVLYVAMGYDKTIDQNLQNMITTQKARAPFIPVDFWDDLDSSFKKIDYPTALLDVYKKYLSTEDAAKLIDFSKTEAGKHFLESLPDTSRQVTAAIQKQQQQTGMQVQARHKDEIDAALKKYREEHAPKPAPTPAGTTPATPSGSSAPGAGAAKPAASSTTPAPTATPATPATTSKTPPPANPPASTTPQN
jgi:hypothetical protein